MRKALIGGLACVVLATLLAACGGGSAHVTGGNGDVSFDLPTGSSFSPRATPVPQADQSILSTVAIAADAKSPSPFIALATPVRLSGSGPFPTGGVGLNFHVPSSRVPPQMKPFVASYDVSTHSWIPVASTYDAVTGTVHAVVPHFSIWGVFSLVGSVVKTLAKAAFDSLFGNIKVTEPAPTCGESTGLSSTEIPPKGLLEVCTQNEANDTSVTVKLESTLAFPIDLTTAKGMQVSVTPIGDLFAEIGGYLNKLGNHQPTTLIAAGSEADITFPLAAGITADVQTNLDMTAYLAGIIESGVDALTTIEAHLGAHPKDTLDAVAQGQCADAVGQIAYATSPISLSALSALTEAAFTCAGSVVDLGASGVVQGIIATVASLIENVLQSGFGAAMLIEGGPSAGTMQVNVARAMTQPTPTLGANWSGNGGGFGQVRPTLVSNGGDPTGVVGGITWQSWGGPMATGTGTSDYVAPGQTVAGGTQEQVTIVAFDLGQCNGTPAYTAVEWYFPTEGQTFDPSSYENACNYFDTPPAAAAPSTAGQWTAPSLTISPEGLGAVQVGMTMTAAQTAAGVAFDGSGDGFYFPTTLPTGYPHDYVGLGGANGVGCVGADGPSTTQTVSTPEGFHLGGTVSQLMAIYGSRLQYAPAPTDGGMTDNAGYIVSESSGNLVFALDSSHTIVNEIAGGPGITLNSCTG
jgi:hypothetical protein